ncbi:MAG: sigma-54 dependent transcriptional regulator [Holosporales bacterium]|jgi:DNA-binding NtrC family response regulator|nr:sigma-54 dependent transcriptional regulator [Holosporales bacterium]
MRLLIVGPLNGHMSFAARLVIKKGVRVGTVDTVDKALQSLRAGQGADLILIDVCCPVADLIERLQSERINVPVIACGEKGDAQAAVRSIKAGAKEYIPLPPEPEFIAAILESIMQDDSAPIAKDPIFKKVLSVAAHIAPSEASVLITGESGTGKEVLARYIQKKSRRATHPFITVNCAAIPETLLESELFGHEKGAFTGAVARRIGKFEEASGGTLLLDEISEMHPALQAKLLRVIQEREICRIGGNQTIKVDIRLLATSNRDLKEEVAQHRFREDLFYRLNVVNLEIPSLRERHEDVLPLSEYFVEKYCKLNALNKKKLSDQARFQLQSYPWPGNVRELENVIHRTVLLCEEEIIERIDALPESHATLESNKSMPNKDPIVFQNGSYDLVGRSISDMEKELILVTLDQCFGNRAHAARILGISIRTLRNKLRLYKQEIESRVG